MSILNRKKGIVLLHTLVTAVILSLLAVTLMKLVLGRYLAAASGLNSVTGVGRVNGYYMHLFSSWNVDFSSIPDSGNIALDGKQVSFVTSGGAVKKVEVSTER